MLQSYDETGKEQNYFDISTFGGRKDNARPPKAYLADGSQYLVVAAGTLAVKAG
jgi:hypothetical protein